MSTETFPPQKTLENENRFLTRIALIVASTVIVVVGLLVFGWVATDDSAQEYRRLDLADRIQRLEQRGR